MLPCSGNMSGIAAFGLGLLIQTRKGKPVAGMPLRLVLKKECVISSIRGVYEESSLSSSSQGSVFFAKLLIKIINFIIIHKTN